MMLNNLKNQNGFALVITLLLMVSISLIGLLALMNASTETLIGRNEKEQKIAFQVAEAGLNEAYARVHLADTNTNYKGYTSVASYACGSTTCSFNTAWPGSTINSSPTIISTGSYTVTVTYATENETDNFCKGACNDEANNIVRFGQDFSFSSSVTNITNGYLPVYKMTSTGTYGNTTVTLNSYLAASSLNTKTQGAIDSNSDPAVSVSGGATNITGTGGACASPYTAAGCTTKSAGYDLNTQLGDTISSIKNMADERHYCKTGNCSGASDDIPSSGAIDTVVSDWGDFAGNTYSTIIYIDNDNDSDYTNANTANNVKISGNFTGRGILVITGDLNLSGGLQYEGLVYVMGTLTVSGGGSGLNVTGGVIANKTVSINGNVTVTYDQATLDAVSRENSSSTVVRWARQ